MLTDGEMLYQTDYFYGTSFCGAERDIFETSKKHLKAYFLKSDNSQAGHFPFLFKNTFLLPQHWFLFRWIINKWQKRIANIN